MTKEIAIREEGYELSRPREIVGMATVLKDYVVKEKLYTTITGKNYAHVEGWQFAGGLIGMFPRVVSVENLSSEGEKKWRADVEIIDLKTDKVISRGFAICSSKESKKAKFDEYAILSMAQTRAIGKAYRNVIGWVMKLAGYESVPSEEMTRGTETTEQPGVPAEKVIQTDPDVDLVCHGLTKSGCGEELTQQEYDYSKKRFGKPLCRKHQKDAKPVTKKSV